MRGSNPKYYWDSCVFLAWLKAEDDRKPGEMDGAREQIELFHKRRISICTSTFTIVEITQAKLPAGAIELLDAVMRRTNFTRIAVDHRVAMLARELRNYYIAKNGADGMRLSAADSVHLATAILSRVDEFHTFDELDKRGRKELGLIPLSGNVAEHNLKICKPKASQMGIKYEMGDDDDEG